jgi:hypothetical protein
MKKEVDEGSLKKAIPQKISSVKYLYVPNRSLQGTVTMMRKEREEKIKFYYGQI